MKQTYIGQWKGYSESGSFVLINIEQDYEVLTGRVSVYESINIKNETLNYWTWSYFKTQPVENNSIIGVVTQPSIHKQYGDLFNDSELTILQKEANMEFPLTTIFNGTYKGEFELEIEWISTYKSGATRKDKVLLKKDNLGISKVNHEEMSWNKFKEYALEQKDGLIYRGQAQNWSLQTSYHRTGQADLISYFDDNIPEVERHINAFSDHAYDIKDDRSLGALLNLAQHHGYPTPLLDWSKSPYVAAFFAFENENEFCENGSISVFEFNEREWANMAGREANIRAPNIVVRTLELPGFGNTRVLPQQSIIMYSNVNDIESIIETNEENNGPFIKAISIPMSDRKLAMRDLSLMGITWGSMFPGFDGICKQLRARHFNK